MSKKPERHYVESMGAWRTLCGLDCEWLMAGITTDIARVTCDNCRRLLLKGAGCRRKRREVT